MYNYVIGNLNSEQLLLGPVENPKLLYSFVMKQKSLGGNQHFCLMEKIWLLHILWYPIHESSEKLTFN